MSGCPENSTECLLRAIAESVSGYNWDPLTFGATAAIGGLALTFALLTVLQGALAAGPGRLKASKRAIGPYASLTRSRFSRTELRIRTVARVPFMQLEMVTSEGAARDGLVSPEHMAMLIFQKLRFEGITSSKSQTSWLALIQCSGVYSEWWKLRDRETDYLPSDVVATPATARIDCLVVMAILAGCESLEMVSGYPLLKGPNAQLKFREHPILGTIAAFDQFAPDHPRMRHSTHFIDQLLLEACGGLRGCPRSPDFSGFTMEPISKFTSRVRAVSIWNELRRAAQCNHNHCTGHVPRHVYEVEVALTLFLCGGAIPVAIILPRSAYVRCTAELLKIKELVQPWPSDEDQSAKFENLILKMVEGERKPWSRGRSLLLRFLTQNSWLETDQPEIPHAYPPGHSSVISMTLDTYLDRIKRRVSKYSEDEEIMRSTLMNVDNWIRHNARDKAACCLVQMVHELSEFSAGASQASTPSRPSPPPDPMTSESPRDWHPLRSLLFFRAALVCILLSHAIDDESFLESGVATEVVTVL